MRYAIALMGIATMAAAAPMNMHMRTNMESDAMMMDAANEHDKRAPTNMASNGKYTSYTPYSDYGYYPRAVDKAAEMMSTARDRSDEAMMGSDRDPKKLLYEEGKWGIRPPSIKNPEGRSEMSDDAMMTDDEAMMSNDRDPKTLHIAGTMEHGSVMKNLEKRNEMANGAMMPDASEMAAAE